MGWATYSCSGCDTCNICVACESGDSCILCDKCQKCDECQVECDEVQYIEGAPCGLLREVVGSPFEFSVRPKKDVALMGPEPGMFNQDVWDEIITYYNKGIKGILQQFIGNGLEYSTHEAVSPFSADEFNRVSGRFDGPTVTAGTLIKGEYFTALEAAVSKATGARDACDKCNIGCDCEGADTSKCVACLYGDTCLKCDSCESCVSGVSDANGGCMDTCCGCDSCNTCQGCDDCNVSCYKGNQATK